MARGRALAAALAVSLLAVSGAGGSEAQTPKRGGTVVFGPVSEPRCLYPGLCEDIMAYWISEVVLPGAFALGSDSTLSPRLASAMFTVRRPFTLTYRIRPEARWSDGVPVTARDFVFTHRAILRVASAPNPHLQVRSIRALGPKTVQVVLRSRMADWRNLFLRVVPQHALAGEDLRRVWADEIVNPKNGRPIGSGPFLLERWERGRRLTLVRNPRYWGPHLAHLDRLVLRFCRQACTAPPPAEALDSLRTGATDIVLNRDLSIIPDLQRIPGVRVFATASTGWDHLAFRVEAGGHPALRGARGKLVRRALAYGIDRVSIARELLGGLDPSYRPSDSAVLLNTSRSYRPTWGGFRYRPDVARRLLERASCRTGADGIYVCGGARLSLRVSTTAGATQRARVLELIQPQLREAGVEIVPDFTTALFSRVLPSGVFDAAFFSWFGTQDAVGGKDVYGCGGVQNFTGYCQRLVTSDLDQADRILDAGKRALVLQRVDRRLAVDVPVIPLYQIPFVFAHRTALRNVFPGPFNPISSAENWWLAQGR